LVTDTPTPCRLPFAPHRHFEPPGQRVGHADADAVQAAREAVGAAGALVELAARVQAGEDQLDHRRLLLGMQAEGDAAAIVLDADRGVGVERDLDFLAVAGQRLVGGVVQHFLDDVQRVVGAGVHARTLLDGLQALEDADRAFRIGRGSLAEGRHGGGLYAWACRIPGWTYRAAPMRRPHQRRT
jgi:hypothetical protein